MSRIAFLDTSGTLHSAAYRTQQEGHAVRYAILTRKPEFAKIGQGIVPRVASLAALIAWKPDVVVAYQTPEEASEFRSRRIPTWGSSAAASSLEDDRIVAGAFAEKAGMALPTTERFTTMEAALRFIDSTPIERWAFKLEGEEVPTDSSHVCRDKEELRVFLDYEGKRAKSAGFVLQECVDGIEVSTEGWYDYRVGWLTPINSTLERKHLMAGDAGPMTGAMGSIVWAWPDDRPRLFRETLLGMTEHLDRINYVGPLDVNTIIGTCSRCGQDHLSGAPHFLEFTPRLGWDAFEAFMSGVDEGQLGDFFVALGRGEVDTVPLARDVFTAALRIYIKRAANVSLIAPWRAHRHLFVKDVWYDGARLRSAGTDTDSGFSVIFEVGSFGSDIGSMMHSIYTRHLPKIHVPDLVYRDDIGEQAQRDVLDLEMRGYAVRRGSLDLPPLPIGDTSYRDRVVIPQPQMMMRGALRIG